MLVQFKQYKTDLPLCVNSSVSVNHYMYMSDREL